MATRMKRRAEAWCRAALMHLLLVVAMVVTVDTVMALTLAR